MASLREVLVRLNNWQDEGDKKEMIDWKWEADTRTQSAIVKEDGRVIEFHPAYR